MTELSLFELCVTAYLTLAFIKAMLCYAVIDSAEGVFTRKYGTHYHAVRLLGTFMLISFVVLVMLPKLLLDEKLSFFFVYSKFKVMRDVSSAI